MGDELTAIFAAVDWRVVIVRHPSGVGWQWSLVGDRRPPEDVWRLLEAHAAAVVASEAYLAWLGSDEQAARFAVALGLVPAPGDGP